MSFIVLPFALFRETGEIIVVKNLENISYFLLSQARIVPNTASYRTWNFVSIQKSGLLIVQSNRQDFVSIQTSRPIPIQANKLASNISLVYSSSLVPTKINNNQVSISRLRNGGKINLVALLSNQSISSPGIASYMSKSSFALKVESYKDVGTSKSVPKTIQGSNIGCKSITTSKPYAGS